jgi:hypothetical protein
MRSATLAGCLVALLVAAFAPAATAELPQGRGVLLPLQDRVGDPEQAELIETLLRQALAEQGDLLVTEDVRSVLRSLRVRDAASESPERLTMLADRLGIDWFFVATLHEMGRGRDLVDGDEGALSSQRREDASETPEVVLSARILRRDSDQLWWAGFGAGSGRDGERLFGLGEVGSLDELTRGVTRDLVAAAVTPRADAGRRGLVKLADSYLRAVGGPSPPELVAVIPMDSAATIEASSSAEVATAALFAALGDLGFAVLLPGAVQAVLQENGQGSLGAVSRSEWEALARDTGARWVATGTVETYRRGQGRTPDPWVAFSVRLIATGDGSIGWLSGLERTGSDTAAAFDRRRIYSTGDLTYEMMRSLFGALRSGPSGARTAGGN